MSDALTLARAIIQAGARGLDDARAEIDQLETSLHALSTEYQRGKLKLIDYAHEAARLREQIDRLKAAVAGAEWAVAKYGSAQAAAAAMASQADAASRDFGRGILATSLTVQDLTALDGNMLESLDRLQARISHVFASLVARSVLAADEAASGIDTRPLRTAKLEATPPRRAVYPVELDQVRERLGIARLAQGGQLEIPSNAPTADVPHDRDRPVLDASGSDQNGGRAGMANASAPTTSNQELTGGQDEPIRGSTPGQRPFSEAMVEHEVCEPGNDRETLRRERVETRLSEAMMASTLGRELRNAGTMSDAGLEARVQQQLAQAGMKAGEIEPLLAGVVQKLRESVSDDVRTHAPEQGSDRRAARSELSSEAGHGAGPGLDQSARCAGVISDTQYLDRLLVAGMPKADPIAGQQLAEAQKTNGKLDRVILMLGKSGKPDVARFAAKKGPA